MRARTAVGALILAVLSVLTGSCFPATQSATTGPSVSMSHLTDP